MGEKYQPTTERAPEISAPRSVERQSSEQYNPKEQREFLEEARRETKEALLAHKEKPENERGSANRSTGDLPHITRQNREDSYRKTMYNIQHRLTGPSRTFSKLIHTPAIERLSDVGAETIARPNAILAGSVCAFLGVLGVYVFARYNGFAVSGFESIAAFIVGWAVGIIYDLLRTLLGRRR